MKEKTMIVFDFVDCIDFNFVRCSLILGPHFCKSVYITFKDSQIRGTDHFSTLFSRFKEFSPRIGKICLFNRGGSIT